MWVNHSMKLKKCDLCGVDDAMQDGVLCPSCREAIARLLVISARERSDEVEAAETTIGAADHPGTKQNTSKAGS